MNHFRIEELSNEQQQEIIDRIVYLRNDVLEMNQSQFSSLLDLSQTYLSLVESGKRPLNTKLVLKVVSAFHVNYEWLITGNKETDIFSTASSSSEATTQLKTETLQSLGQVYSLKTKDIDFLQWFLALSNKERSEFIQAIDNISRLYPHN